MKIHVIQHADFEDEGLIGKWASEKKYPLSRTLLHKNETLPELDNLDWLVVMGGPMSANEENQCNWMKPEKEFIKRCIDSGKTILGICLGAQLLSDVLGGAVTKNPVKEIGWFQVKLTLEGRKSQLMAGFPGSFMAYHWHGDTFSIPPGARHIASSEACICQGFEYKEKVIGLQFHIETTEAGVKKLLDNCGRELTECKTIQGRAAQVAGFWHLLETGRLLYRLLDNLAQKR